VWYGYLTSTIQRASWSWWPRRGRLFVRHSSWLRESEWMVGVAEERIR
jgi:hypothetical protein